MVSTNNHVSSLRCVLHFRRGLFKSPADDDFTFPTNIHGPVNASYLVSQLQQNMHDLWLLCGKHATYTRTHEIVSAATHALLIKLFQLNWGYCIWICFIIRRHCSTESCCSGNCSVKCWRTVFSQTCISLRAGFTGESHLWFGKHINYSWICVASSYFLMVTCWYVSVWELSWWSCWALKNKTLAWHLRIMLQAFMSVCVCMHYQCGPPPPTPLPISLG